MNNETEQRRWAHNFIQQTEDFMDYSVGLYSYRTTRMRPRFTDPYKKRGIEVSDSTCKQVKEVFPTPWMKNIAKAIKDVEFNPETGKYSKLECGKHYKCVEVMNQYVKNALEIITGEFNPKAEYDHSKPLTDITHYFTDCQLGWKEKIWDIQPGQAKQRAEVFDEYTKPIPWKESLKMLYSHYNTLPASTSILYSLLPSLKIEKDELVVGELSAPFLSKGTGVSYPFYRNDREKVTEKEIVIANQFIDWYNFRAGINIPHIVPKDKETMANFCIRLVSLAFDNCDIDYFCDFISQFNVYTGYPRNQRGKGRALEAMSRLTNLAVNLIESKELEGWKDSIPLGTAFQRRDVIKERLIKMVELCQKYNMVCINEDSSGWDRNVQPALIGASALLRYKKCGSMSTSALFQLRTGCALRSLLLANGKCRDFYGRTGSGYDDTTLQNSSSHWIIANGARAKILGSNKLLQLYNDPLFRDYSCFIVGDDICFVVPDGFRKQIIDYYKENGQTIHEDEKSIFGPMFIQWRLFEYNGSLIISYNFPRVIRSLCSKEDSKQLGVGGWIASCYSTAGNCIEYDKGLLACIVWILAFDPYSLMLEYDFQTIKGLIKLEDAATTNKVTTFERITGKNPQSNAGTDDWDDDFFNNFILTTRKAIEDNLELCEKLIEPLKQYKFDNVRFEFPEYYRDYMVDKEKQWKLPPSLSPIIHFSGK